MLWTQFSALPLDRILASLRSVRFSFQTARLRPSVIVSARTARRVDLFPLVKNARGRSAERRGPSLRLRRKARAATQVLAVGRASKAGWRTGLATRRLSALHHGDFGPRDHAKRPDRSFRPMIPRAFARVRPPASCHRRRPRVVGVDGDPRPPGDGLRGTSAGAASRSVFETPPEAPSLSGTAEMIQNYCSNGKGNVAMSPLCTGRWRCSHPRASMNQRRARQQPWATIVR
jgi:hypothetical protein